MDTKIQHTFPCIDSFHSMCADCRFYRIHVKIHKYRLNICQNIMLFHFLQNPWICDLTVYDSVSVLRIVLTIWRFRNRFNHHIHRTVTDTVYRCLHLMPVKKCKQIIQFFLCECNDSGISRRILIWFIHRCCPCTQRSILNQFHRADRKVVSTLTGTVSFFNKCFRILCTLKQTLLIMSDIQLTSRIQRFICIHDALPVLSRKRCQIIRLHSGESAFIQFLRTIYNVTFHLFLGRSFQHRRIKLYSIFFQKSGLKIYIFCYLRKLWNFFQTFKPRCIADCHMSAYTDHDDWNFF